MKQVRKSNWIPSMVGAVVSRRTGRGDDEQEAEAGINLVRCHDRAALDRLHARGLSGVMPLNVRGGATEALGKHVEAVRDHPALAAWEGPDEIVWTFTAYSGLYRKMGIYKSPDGWWRQTPRAIEYSQQRAREIMPKLREGIHLVRRLDARRLPFWINEAHESDVQFVRQYLDEIDVTGCDLYPVKHDEQPIFKMGSAVERWKQVGRGKPVWMVLQAFSWHELGDYYGHKTAAYPTFAESRFMAYDVIAHGARGILYWGSAYLKSEAFRESLYALTSELASLQPFLIATEQEGVRVNLIEPYDGRPRRGVRVSVRRASEDWLVILVNEDDRRHMGVEVVGLEALDNCEMALMYGTETTVIERGELVTRMQPFEVKVFATGSKWETDRREGRAFGRRESR